MNSKSWGLEKEATFPQTKNNLTRLISKTPFDLPFSYHMNLQKMVRTSESQKSNLWMTRSMTYGDAKTNIAFCVKVFMVINCLAFFKFFINTQKFLCLAKDTIPILWMV